MNDRAQRHALLPGVLLFVLGLALGLAGIRLASPAPEPPLLARRLERFDPQRDAFDTLFFGSSRVFRGIDPVAFDAETARRGRPTRSFNRASPGWNPTRPTPGSGTYSTIRPPGSATC